MNTTLIRKTTSHQVISMGWRALVKELGPLDAARFWMSMTFGEGDSILEYRDMWKGKNVEAIHQEILKAKEDGEI